MKSVKRLVGPVLLLGLALGAAGRADASIVVDASDVGFFDSNGTHFANNKNYPAGSGARDFFVFDLSGITDTIIGASFVASNPATGTLSGTVTYTMYDVNTPIVDLEQMYTLPTGRTDIYMDLGTGTPYGSQEVSPADQGNPVTVTLNASAITALNAARGSSIALGGSLGTSTELIFVSPDVAGSIKQLVLETTPAVPEPSTFLTSGLVGLMGLGYAWRRRKTEAAA